MERRAVTKSQKGEKASVGGEWENAISGKQLDSVRKETHVLIPRLKTDAIRDKKDNRPLLHQKRKHRLAGTNPQKVQAAERQDSVRTIP